MKKKIRVNTKILKESSIKVGDKNYEQRLRRRVTDLRRVSQMAKSAAIKAEEAGNTELAKKLNDRVEEIEKLLATYNIDTIDTEEVKTEDENVDIEDSEKDPEEEDKDSEENDKDDSDDKNNKDPIEPQDPREPAGPKIPVNPIEPQDPVEPTEPGDPIEPTEIDPIDPTKPIEPVEPTEIEIDPIEPVEPVEPVEPTEVDPIEPGEPTEEYPGEPGEPKKKKETDEEDEDEKSEDDPEEDDSDTDTDKNNKKSKGKKDSEDDDSDDEEEEEDTDTDSEETKNTKKGSDGEEDSDDEEDDSDEEETDDSPVNDPFADEEDIPKLNLGGGMQEPRDATLKDIIKQLKGLSPEGKRGALTALQDIINSRKSTTESLTEAVKGVREMTDDEFGDYINNTYDLIDQVEVLDYEDEEEIKKKKAKVGQWSTDPKTLKELEAEDDVALEKDFRKEKARDKEKQKYTRIGTLDQFKLNFYRAINNQVEAVRQEVLSYLEINPEYESEDVIVKAEIMKEMPEVTIPVIDIYFDVSASWTQADIDIGKKAIATVKGFEDAGEIKLNIFYFGDEVSSNYHEVCNGGTTAWRKVLQNIKATGAQNVLIMTDDDIEQIGKMGQKPWYSHYAQYGAIGGPTCKVDGCVWFLWKNGESSPSCVDHLIGRQGNYQYAFYN